VGGLLTRFSNTRQRWSPFGVFEVFDVGGRMVAGSGEPAKLNAGWHTIEINADPKG
jgi:hypothetical protein